MEAADFSGYATKAGLKCSDGRTITAQAFQHMDGMKVPLVWQHGHADANNVLGHALLESRPDGVYAHGFFNDTSAGQTSKTLVQHGDIRSLSIYANNLVEKSKNVVHGQIREVSLVLSGANPGAVIDQVRIQHSSDPDDVSVIEDEAVIRIGEDNVDLEFAHSDEDDVDLDALEEEVEELQHAAGDDEGDEETIQDVYDSLDEDQKKVVHYLVGAALEAAADANSGGSVAQSATSTDSSTTDSSTPNNEGNLAHQEGTTTVGTRNVFEQNAVQNSGPTLSHDQLKSIVETAQKNGSFKEAFLAHATEYGIDNIDVLFPDAQSLTNTPDVIGRRQEWVADVISGTKHSPFSRIKSTAVDLTADEARAKGYVKGNLKKEEIIKLLKRVTTPTTIYKKQKLDRDDIVDITDLDVVAWLKAEMRLMLDEELARAVLIGDGREADSEDKIDEDHLRPIAYDADMYTHSVVVASDLSGDSVVEAILRTRTYYKGTGTPTLYTTDGLLTDLMLLKDKMGRRIYTSEQELAAALRVAKIVTVEVMEDTPDIVAIIVNLADYTLGADRGGAVSMFDDFDIDYNQYKYLIETRVSGALTKPKSAVVVKRTVGVVVTPGTPSYNGTTHELTFPATSGVVYSIDGVTQTGTVTISETVDVEARPATGYSFPVNTVRDWTYVYTA